MCRQYLPLKTHLQGLLPLQLSWHALQCVCVCLCVWPCLLFLLGHDKCSPISTVQAAGQKGKQTQQATVVDLFIGPQTSSQASAPCAGSDSQTSKSCLLFKKKKRKEKPRWKQINSQFSFFFGIILLSNGMQLSLWQLWACGWLCVDGEGVWRQAHH